MGRGIDRVIRSAHVIGCQRDNVETVDICLRGGEIIDITSPDVVPHDSVNNLDASEFLVIPGLINAHTHGHGTLAKGLGDRWTLELLLNAGPWLTAERSVEYKYLAATLGAAEMIKKGCTGVYDLYVEMPAPSVDGMHAVAQAYADCGMRAVVAPMLADRTFFEAIPGLACALSQAQSVRPEKVRMPSLQTSLGVCEEMIESWPVDWALVRPALAPTIPLHCSDEMLSACATKAREFGVALHMHLAESKVQALSGLERYGKTLTRHLHDIGFLGPNFTAAHGVWLSDEDCRILADNGCSVAHNPGSNLRLGSGIAPVRNLLDAGVNVGVGTDGAHCADNQNMFEAMRLASFVSRVRSHDTDRWISTQEAFEMATLGSARSCGFGDRVGRIEVGLQADLVMLNLKHINWIPLNNPINQLVHSEDGCSVDTVMINGDVVLQGGQYTQLDIRALADQAEAARGELSELNADARRLAQTLEDSVSHFCLGLCKTPYRVDAMANVCQTGVS